MREHFVYSKPKLPRKLKKAVKGIERHISTKHFIEDGRFRCDEFVTYIMIGRATKHKRKFIRLLINEEKKMRKELEMEKYAEIMTRISDIRNRYANRMGMELF